MSLSARRAWIEKSAPVSIANRSSVALRKESVDRNCLAKPWYAYWMASLSARRAWIEIIQMPSQSQNGSWSLSARRAWIEIGTIAAGLTVKAVALRKESVDRNLNADGSLKQKC